MQSSFKGISRPRTRALSESQSLCAVSNTVLRSSAQAKQILAADDTLDHEYLPIAGLPSFVKATSKLIFGADSPALSENRVVT